jgi:hypothetical protein
VDAFVPVEAATEVLNPLPIVPLTSLLGTHIAPTIAVSADTAEVGKLVTIFGRILFPVQGIAVQRKIPTTVAFAARAFHSATIGRFFVNPVHERIGMSVVHVLGWCICHHATIIAVTGFLSIGKRNGPEGPLKG